jgi:hypothetical protein
MSSIVSRLLEAIANALHQLADVVEDAALRNRFEPDS